MGGYRYGANHEDTRGGSITYQRETAQYLADMILELRNTAKGAKLHTITVPLEYAYYEAFSVANRVAAPAAELERLRDLSKIAESEEHG